MWPTSNCEQNLINENNLVPLNNSSSKKLHYFRIFLYSVKKAILLLAKLLLKRCVYTQTF